MDKNNGIGKNNTLPWSLKKEQKFFVDITKKCEENKRNVVIMGRKTWESIPKNIDP